MALISKGLEDTRRQAYKTKNCLLRTTPFWGEGSSSSLAYNNIITSSKLNMH
jgi:hypothetical protein